LQTHAPDADLSIFYNRGVLRPAYPIATRRLLLRPFVPEDLDALHAIQSRPDVARYLYWEPRSREEVRGALAARARWRSLEAEGDTLGLAVVLRDTGALIGDVNLDWLSREHRQGEIGFVFHPDHGGRGYATEAATEMLRMGFGRLGLHRIVGRCDARNAASARLMERLGMRREAHFRHNEVFKGEWGEEYVYAIIEDEWVATKTGARS
jgi:RimJ/RimL family protein N-acetyltransferase